MKSICVYCGSNAGSKPAYTERAIALGDRIGVMHEGHLSPALPHADWSRETIGLAMAGSGPV